MKRAQLRLQAVLDTAVDGVILIDSGAKIFMFNPACERLFGYTANEVNGQNVKMLMPEPFHDEHDQYLRNYRETGERKIIGIGREVAGRRKDGSIFPMELSVGESNFEGDVVFVGIIRDVTARKLTEEKLVQAQKMEMVGQLSGGLAHDFNNLLTVIMGNAELLAEKLKPRPDLMRFCETVIAAAERGAELTRRLLVFSRRQDLTPATVNCNQLIEGLKVIFSRTLHEDIEILTSLDEHVGLVNADPAQLESALLNLALNAQDAMPDGGMLSIHTENVEIDHLYQERHLEMPAGTYVLISLTDDGTGMPPEIAERVFEPFFTTKEVGKGTGLGLSMVYGFIKQSGGHVVIYSEVGLGTSVKLYLPTHKGSALNEDQTAALTGSETLPGSGTILVVEDDPFVRGYAVGCVEALGYRVITASNGREALERLDDHLDEVDLLFSDVVMPGGMSGWELTEKAREMKPGLKVLLTSGYQFDSSSKRWKNSGSIAIINKPYRKATLARRLEDALGSTTQ